MAEKSMTDILKNAGVGYDPSKPKGEKCTTAPEVTPAEKMLDAMGTITESAAKLTAVGPNKPTALEKSVWLKRLEDSAKLIRTELLIEQANREFAAAIGAAKTISVDGARLQRYTYPQKYEYPMTIMVLEEQLKREKKTAEADGSAKVIKRAESSTDTTFTISA